MEMSRARAMLEVRTITEVSFKRSELIIDEVDYIGFYNLKSGHIIYRISCDKYSVIEYQGYVR
jgi:hypothetical protein